MALPRGKRKPLSPALGAQWAQLAHVLYLQALMSETNWTCKQIAFQGGTSLHLSWGSPRHSEDLDFLLSKEIQAEAIQAVSKRVALALKEQFTRIDPRFEVELRPKTKDASRMVVDQIVISHPGYIGNAMAKAEFWRVEDSYLADYPVALRTPRAPGRPDDLVGVISSPVPAATLATAYADKLTAFATRPNLKWRDVFDLWWIGTQAKGDDVDPASPAIIKQFLHNVTAYATRDDLPPADALRLFLQLDRNEVIAKADPDLRRWLPDKLWDQLHRMGGIEDMVDYVRMALATVADGIDGGRRDKDRDVGRLDEADDAGEADSDTNPPRG